MKIINRDKVKKLNEDGLVDHEIAKKLGCSPGGVWIVRSKELGLPSNRHKEKTKLYRKVGLSSANKPLAFYEKLRENPVFDIEINLEEASKAATILNKFGIKVKTGNINMSFFYLEGDEDKVLKKTLTLLRKEAEKIK